MQLVQKPHDPTTWQDVMNTVFKAKIFTVAAELNVLAPITSMHDGVNSVFKSIWDLGASGDFLSVF